jgi:hypothetical protein
MKFLGLALAFWILLPGWSVASPGALQLLAFDPKALPTEIRYEGKVVAGARWQDKNGENLLLLCQTGPFKSPRQELGEDDAKDARLYGYHYVRDKSRYQLFWKLYDYVDSCRFDLTAFFIRKSLTITDLDGNGIAESTFMYRLGCRSDIHPLQLKLIMHEGKAKYALRGETLVNVGAPPGGGPDRIIGGLNTIDPAFRSAPKTFLDYTLQQWKIFEKDKLRAEEWEEYEDAE